MPVWLAALLGVVQGLTEFLPVSSSGHLALFQNIFDMSQYTDNHIAFDIVLHLGTLVAVVIGCQAQQFGSLNDNTEIPNTIRKIMKIK